MLILIVGLILFLGIHSISIVAPAWRDRQVAQRGEALWKGLYATLSVLGFLLIIYGYAEARQSSVILYAPPAGMKHATLLLMLPVFPLLLAAYLPGRIKTTTKHPLLLATKLWAFSHLMANGTLADVLLFGSFLVWAVLDRISLQKRSLRPVPSAPASRFNDAIVLLGGLALYAVFVGWGHLLLIGVSPI